jgi:hypothetical protein
VVGDFTRFALADRAIDASATFPTRRGYVFTDALRRAGGAIKRWFGWGDRQELSAAPVASGRSCDGGIR